MNEPNFKIMCNCIHELLNVFEDPAHCIHTTRIRKNLEILSSIRDHRKK